MRPRPTKSSSASSAGRRRSLPGASAGTAARSRTRSACCDYQRRSSRICAGAAARWAMHERIVVGMRGGVESSVAAALLVEQGDEVVGVTMRVSPWSAPDEPTKRFGSCCGTEAADDARSVARALGVPYYVLNMEGEFDRAVVGPFADAYRRGETPVPCLQCNSDL